MYDHQERLEREFAPTLTHLREVEGQIEFHKGEIAKLAEIHRRLVAIEKIIHPPAAKKAKQNGAHSVAETTLQEAIVFLRQNYPEEQFYSRLLLENPGWEPSESHTAKILAALHDQNLIYLNAKGIGGRKLYRVTA